MLLKTRVLWAYRPVRMLAREGQHSDVGNEAQRCHRDADQDRNAAAPVRGSRSTRPAPALGPLDDHASAQAGYVSRMRLGYTLMSEQSGPRELVVHAAGGERAGFDFEVI